MISIFHYIDYLGILFSISIYSYLNILINYSIDILRNFINRLRIKSCHISRNEYLIIDNIVESS